MNTSRKQGKDKPKKLSDQVKEILFEKGYSFLFDYQEFRQLKKYAKKNFNPAQDIAEWFIQENNAKSDFSDYVW